MATKKRRRKRRNPLRTFLEVLLALILVVGIGGYLVFHHFYAETSFEKSSILSDILPDEAFEDSTEEEMDSEEENSLLAQIEEQQSAVQPISDKNVYNLLLIGVDRRDKTWNGNSDCMILASINQKKGTVTLTSFMRDTGVNVSGYGLKKMNYAYAVGGGDKLVETIQSNFGITVDNYVWVDFSDVKDIIDLIGGIDIQLTDKEVAFVNKNSGSTEIAVSSSQTYHLNGAQALAHARDRYSGDNDYGRTQRQRDVIMACVAQVKNCSAKELISMSNDLLPYVHHNISQTELLSLVANSPKILNYTFSQQRVPFDGMYTTSGEKLIPNYTETNQKLQETIYGN